MRAPVGADEVLSLLGHFVEQGLSIALGFDGVFAQIDVFKVQAFAQFECPLGASIWGLPWGRVPGWLAEGVFSDEEEQVQYGQAFDG